MSILLDDPDLIELTVNRDEIGFEVLDNRYVAIVGQDPHGEYFRMAVEMSDYLEIADSLEHEWSVDVILPRTQIWGRP